MKVTSLRIYPVKSLGSIEIETAFAGEKGFAMDRRWMVVKPDGKFITQLEFPKMSCITVKIENKTLVFNNQLSNDRISISTDEITNELEVEIWDDLVLAYEVNTEVSEWFSRQIGETAKLVRMGEASRRNISHQALLPSIYGPWQILFLRQRQFLFQCCPKILQDIYVKRLLSLFVSGYNREWAS